MNISDMLKNMVPETPAVEIQAPQIDLTPWLQQQQNQSISNYDLMNQIGLAIKRR